MAHFLSGPLSGYPRRLISVNAHVILMSPLTHALLPAIVGYRWIPRTAEGRPSLKAAGIVGVFGMLPDLLNPHLSLDSRHHSWSHTVLVWSSLTLLIALVAWQRPQLVRWKLAVLLSLAYLGHLACDAISGGIAPLLPFSPVVIGNRFFPFSLWFYCDAVLAAVAYVMFRVLPPRHPTG
jgi:hypothetical protein